MRSSKSEHPSFDWTNPAIYSLDTEAGTIFWRLSYPWVRAVGRPIPTLTNGKRNSRIRGTDNSLWFALLGKQWNF